MRNQLIAVLAFVALAFGILLVFYWIIGWIQKARGVAEEAEETPAGGPKSLSPAWGLAIFMGFALLLLIRIAFGRPN